MSAKGVPEYRNSIAPAVIDIRHAMRGIQE
jgi:hypothetical protein